jgi:tRNA dimethylallyltransferase
VDPGEEFSVAQFRRAADAALADLDERGSVPMLVGGTGLYLRAVVDRLRLPGRYPEVAAALERERDTASLHRRLAALDPVAAGRIDPANRRRVVRALEVTLGAGRPFSSFGPGLDAHPAVPHVMVGLHVERDQLGTRIRARLAAQLAAGFLEEVRALADRPTGLSRTAAQALGYRELLAHLRGECTLEDAVELAVVRTRQFAVRQLRWFRRDPRIEWVDASLATGELADRIERRWLGVPNAMGRPGSGQLP